MIQLSDKETGAEIGALTPEQLQFLIDQLEEEHAQDQDYYINRATLELFEEKGIDAQLLGLLQNALGDREDMEIIWARS